MKSFNVGGKKEQNAAPAAPGAAPAAGGKKSLFGKKNAPAGKPSQAAQPQQPPAAGARDKRKGAKPPKGGKPVAPQKKSTMILAAILIVVLGVAGFAYLKMNEQPQPAFPVNTVGVPGKAPFGAKPATGTAAVPTKPPTGDQKLADLVNKSAPKPAPAKPPAAVAPTGKNNAAAIISGAAKPAPKPTAEVAKPKPAPKPVAAAPKPKAEPKRAAVAPKPKPAPKPVAAAPRPKPATKRVATAPKRRPAARPVIRRRVSYDEYNSYVAPAPRPRSRASRRTNKFYEVRERFADRSNKSLVPAGATTWEIPADEPGMAGDTFTAPPVPSRNSQLRPLPGTGANRNVVPYVSGSRAAADRLYEWRPVNRGAVVVNAADTSLDNSPAPRGSVQPVTTGLGFSRPVQFYMIFIKESADKQELVNLAQRIHLPVNPEITSHTDGVHTNYTLTLGHYTSEVRANNVAQLLTTQGIRGVVVTEKVYH